MQVIGNDASVKVTKSVGDIQPAQEFITGLVILLSRGPCSVQFVREAESVQVFDPANCAILA